MVPDFRRTKLSAHFDLQNVTIDFKKDKCGERFMRFSCKKAAIKEDAGRLRRLKELASIGKDCEKEQELFALELKAKRFHETTGSRLLLSYAYQLFSDFGRSVARPVIGLVTTWLFFGIYFAHCPNFGPCTKIGDGLSKSASLLFPFLGASRTSLKADFVGLDAVVAFGEGGLGVLFLFLIGLALRNRFRI